MKMNTTMICTRGTKDFSGCWTLKDKKRCSNWGYHGNIKRTIYGKNKQESYALWELPKMLVECCHGQKEE